MSDPQSHEKFVELQDKKYDGDGQGTSCPEDVRLRDAAVELNGRVRDLYATNVESAYEVELSTALSQISCLQAPNQMLYGLLRFGLSADLTLSRSVNSRCQITCWNESLLNRILFGSP
jgi:hypothetical protein